MNEQQVGKASRIASLIVGNMQHNLTSEERQELDAWLKEGGENFLLYEELMDEEKLGEALDEMHAIDQESAYAKLSQRILSNEPSPKRITIWWYMVAAALLIIAGGITYMYINKNSKPAATPMVVIASKKPPGLQPDSKKALLLLNDGSAISLNEMNNGFVVQQGNVTVNKKRNGELEYVITGNADNNSTNYNTIQTPRGSEYKVVLNDGTRIWLNAASTLRFPIHFSNDLRKVQLTGEAYFEVAHMTSPHSPSGEGGVKKIPFIVGVDNMEVQAIGTSFNISAYKEDSNTQTTVVEGLVKVSRKHKDHLLSPGKKLVANDTSIAIEDADVKTETGWRTGDFVFHNSSLQIVMNELARWYDMDVVYEQPAPSLHFTGEIPRDAAINKVLEMLEYTGGVHFTINNRVIKVISSKL